VHLVGFYYKNTSRCTVLWMSDSSMMLGLTFKLMATTVDF